MATDFAYGRICLTDIEIHGVRNLQTGRFSITGATVDGQLVVPTREFWNDLFRRFCLTSGWAAGKSDARRFEWLAAHYGEYQIPYCIVWNEHGEACLLPVPDRKMRRPKRRVRAALSTPSLRTVARTHVQGCQPKPACRRRKRIAQRTGMVADRGMSCRF